MAVFLHICTLKIYFNTMGLKLIALTATMFFITARYEMSGIRESYVNAATSEAGAGKFYSRLETVEDSHPNSTIVAYKAASIVLKARYESGLFAKAKLFNRGTELLDATIAKAPADYEARLIRLNIQDNVPWITGYTSAIKKDKAFLVANYAKQAPDLKTFAKAYVVQSDAFTEKEKAAFN